MRRPSTPCTFSRSSTTVLGPCRPHAAGADRVIGGVCVAADELQNLLVARHAPARRILLAAQRIHRLGLDDAAHHAEAVDHGALVDRIGEEIESDRRMVIGVGRADVDRAEALRAQLIAGHRHGREFLQPAGSRVLDGVRHDVHLDVGRGELGARLEERQHRRRRQAEEAAAGGHVFQGLPDRAQPARHVIVGQALVRHAPGDARIDVVAEVLAHRRQGVANLDAMRFQDLRFADAGELQELRRGHGAGAQDHLAARTRLHLAPPSLVDDACAALALEQQPARRRLGDDGEVGAPHSRPQVAMRHAHAPAATDAGLRLDDAFLVLAVVVRVELVAGGDGGLEQRVVERVLVGHLGHDRAGHRCRARCCRPSRNSRCAQTAAPRPASSSRARPSAPRCRSRASARAPRPGR